MYDLFFVQASAVRQEKRDCSSKGHKREMLISLKIPSNRASETCANVMKIALLGVIEFSPWLGGQDKKYLVMHNGTTRTRWGRRLSQDSNSPRCTARRSCKSPCPGSRTQAGTSGIRPRCASRTRNWKFHLDTGLEHPILKNNAENVYSAGF